MLGLFVLENKKIKIWKQVSKKKPECVIFEMKIDVAYNNFIMK